MLALPVTLSLIAGLTDTIGFLGLNGLFTAHVTGNIVVLAASVAAGSPALLSDILSVPVFMLVLLLASVTAGAIERAGRSSVRPLLLLQLLALLGFLALSVAAEAVTDPNDSVPVIAGMLGVAAMAVQNGLVQIALKNTPSTAVMTTNITHLMVDLGALLVRGDPTEVGTAKTRVVHTFPVIFGFAIGCAIGAAAQSTVRMWSLVLPAALAVLALFMRSAPPAAAPSS